MQNLTKVKQRKPYIILLFVISIIVISFWKFLPSYYYDLQQRQVLHQLVHQRKNNQLLDTYYERIKQFLNERNFSMKIFEKDGYDNSTSLHQAIMRKIYQLGDRQYEQLLNRKNDEEIEHGCQQSCCWYKRKTKSFYNGEANRYPTASDRLSVSDLRLFADTHYGIRATFDKFQSTELTDDILPCLQNHTVIFIHTHNITHFFDKIYEKITVDYIIITGDSDFAVPRSIPRKHLPLLNEIFAGKTNIIHWFAMNCNLGNNKQWEKSTIFSCVPIGMSRGIMLYLMHIANGKDDSISNRNLKTNDYWVLTSFNSSHGRIYREPLWNLSCHGRLKPISKCVFNRNQKNLLKFYYHIGRSKFVFSPPGAGFDCYRHWEALYLGAIPIIIRSPIDSLFEKLPVLFVNNYEEVNLKMLVNAYNNMTKQKYDYRRLYKGYWQRKINFYRKSPKLIQFHYKSIR